MLFNTILLFLSALLPGLAVFFIPRLNQKRFRVILSFSGAYLFSITVIHILPELYISIDNPVEGIKVVGMYVLFGFFFQMILEYFTSGVEHGHIHVHEEDKAHVPYSILIALCIHSFLEGTLLVHPAGMHEQEDVDSLLWGLMFHKAPEAFALMSVLVYRLERKYLALILLLIFSAASPLGLLLTDTFFNRAVISKEAFTFLFAVIAGNFLYISTTIFFETSPNHQFKANKLLVSMLGAAAAILAEYFL